MAKIYTLLVILAISTLFISVPHTGEIGFPTHPTYIDRDGSVKEVKLSLNQYVWMAGEHLIMIALAWIILDESTDHKFPLKVFLFLQVASFIGFIIAYSDPLKSYVITFNILKLLIFLAAIGIDQWNQSRRVSSSLK